MNFFGNQVGIGYFFWFILALSLCIFFMEVALYLFFNKLVKKPVIALAVSILSVVTTSVFLLSPVSFLMLILAINLVYCVIAAALHLSVKRRARGSVIALSVLVLISLMSYILSIVVVERTFSGCSGDLIIFIVPFFFLSVTFVASLIILLIRLFELRKQ